MAPPAKTTSPATASPLQSGLDKVNRMIEVGRVTYPVASENLRHWRDGKGTDRVIPANAFQSEAFFLAHLLKEHRPRFIEGARKRIGSKVLVPGKPVEMDWTDSVYAPYFSDLYFALGGFTVHSKVQVESTVNSTDQAVVIQFVSWRVEIMDDYNWDPGKSTLIPGVGTVTDDEMRALEHAGYGRNFHVRSEWATITDPQITAPVTIPLGSIGR